MRVIDGDSHFIEPLDLFERYIDPAYRDRTVPSGPRPEAASVTMLIVDKPPMLARPRRTDERLRRVRSKRRRAATSATSTAIRIASQNGRTWTRASASSTRRASPRRCSIPRLGIVWEGEVDDPHWPTRSAAPTTPGPSSWSPPQGSPVSGRAYLDPRRRARGARDGARREARMPHHLRRRRADRRAQLRPSGLRSNLGRGAGTRPRGRHPPGLASQLHRQRVVPHRKPGLMYFTMRIVQDPRIALTSMMFDGVFERFPRLRVGTIESMAGWVGEWLERIDYRYSVHGSHLADETFGRPSTSRATSGSAPIPKSGCSR